MKLTNLLTAMKRIATSKLGMSFAIASLLAAFAFNTEINNVEAFFYDLRMKWKGEESVHPDIVLMALGEEGRTQIDLPIDSIDAHLKALENLVAHKPKVIAYVNRFDPGEVEAKPVVADRFVAVAEAARKEGTEVIFGTEIDLAGEVLPPYPLSLLPHAPAILHKDGTMFSEDKVMRRALLTTYFNEPSLHMKVAFPELTREALIEKARQVRGSYYYEPADSWHVMIRYPEDTNLATTQFPIVSFADAAENIDLEKVRGKIILVEAMRRDHMNDFAYSPYSRSTYRNPRLVVHGAILDTLLKNSGIITLPSSINALVTFLLALLLAFIAISMSPSRGVAALALLSIGLFASSMILFRLGYWVPLVQPLLAMFLTYYLIVPYRAILEYKKRWEVQEKHDLLVQVEEMKGNFLSLMSHDLKTPVARIQGLAELVLRQGSLLPQQQHEIKEIISSTENLDKFISKILHLTKVESNEIKLEKKSKDINKILEQCVEKLEFQAKAKNIQVDLQLEPLFPIHVDASLINQVFTNIIDNAIKYSPKGSLVRISSKEVGDFVEIVVEDTGPGFDEKEQEQLFTKFFRGKSHPGDQTKGSGLGLYLSKYFIELHQGKVRAESEKGIGSKFKIELPIQGSANV